MPDYTAVPGLDLYLFEESYVLGFDVGDDHVALDIDAALTERHPRYEPPRPGEHLCYRRARLAFLAASHVRFDRSDAPPARDAAGEVDHGSIDVFTVEGDRHHLEGEWGTLDLRADGANVVVREDPLSGLRREILVAGGDDWVPLLAMDGMLRTAETTIPVADRSRVLADVLTDLVDRGLVEIGSVTRGSGFTAFDGASTGQRVSHAYAESELPGWGFAIWCRNTARGDEAAVRLSAPPS